MLPRRKPPPPAPSRRGRPRHSWARARRLDDVGAVTRRTANLAIVAAALALLVGIFVAEPRGRAGDHRHGGLPELRGPDRGRGGALPRLQGRVPAARADPFAVPSLFSSTQSGYDAVFLALMVFAFAGCSVLIVVALGALRASTARVVGSVGAFWAGIALLGPFLLTRFDLFSALVTLAACHAILHRRERLGPVLLGLAIATKIYPAVLLPLLVPEPARRGAQRAALARLRARDRHGGARLPALRARRPRRRRPQRLAPGRAPAPDREPRLGRPPRAPQRVRDAARLGVRCRFPEPDRYRRLGRVDARPSRLVAILVLVWLRFARGDIASDERFARYCAAAIVAFVALGKVLSPQFLVWVVAAVVLVQGTRGTVATALAARRLRPHPAVVPALLLGPREAVRPDGVVARAAPRPRAPRRPRHARRAARRGRAV